MAFKPTAENLNRRIETLREKIPTPFTDLHYIQQQNTTIIKQYDEKGGGNIRTYEESVQFLKKGSEQTGLPYVELTREQYEKELLTFYNQNRKHFNVGYEIVTAKAGYYQLLKNKVGRDLELDWSKVSVMELKDMFDEFKDDDKIQNSHEMFEELVEALEVLYGN